MKLEDILLNCAVVDDDELSRSMLTHLIKKMEGLNLVKTCESAMEAYNFLQVEEDIDLLFLDIEMPEMTGLELVKLLEKRKMHVILTTSQEHYALEAFEYDVTDYLVKPINQARLLKAVTKVREKINNELGNQSQDLPYIFVRSNHKIIKLAPDEIQYIEALSDYILIHATKQKHVVHATMKSIEEKLATFKGFIRTHRSYIVNMLHVDVVHDLNVNIKEKQIPIGRSYRAKFLEGLDVL
jgi:DNA-binding LytR/AlgR family response regulator